jgi:hypothetical protein
MLFAQSFSAQPSRSTRVRVRERRGTNRLIFS